VALTDKQQRFIEEYMRDFNATQAAIRAGYQVKAAYAMGAENLRKPLIAEEITKRKQTLAEDAGVFAQRTIRELGRIAYFDPRKLFDREGNPIPITELDDDTAAAVAGLDVLEEFDGVGEDRRLTGWVKKWKIANKNDALKQLAEYHSDGDGGQGLNYEFPHYGGDEEEPNVGPSE